MAAPAPQVHEIDISKHAKALHIATMANYVLAYLCLVGSWEIVVLHIGLFGLITPEHFFISILSAMLCTFCAVGLLQDTAKIAYAAFHRLSLVYPVSILAFSSLIVGPMILEWEMRLEWEIIALLLTSWACAIVGLVFVWRLRRSPLPVIHVSAAELVARHHGDEIALPSESIGSTKIKKSNAPLAVVLILVGLLGIVYQPASELLVVTLSRYYGWSGRDWLVMVVLASSIAPWLGIAGFALLLRARRYLQISADAMLAVDNRAPVVFLRAFEDEERPDYRQSQKALLDFSLETRLAEHVRYVGPFVAVGCPTDRAPLLGALREKLPDSEWQGHVMEWISKASVIIMYAGKTRWVNWELGKVIEKERAESMILIMPEKKRERGVYGYLSGRPKGEDMALRIDRIKQVFASTKWRSVLTEIRDIQGIRVLLFEGDGSVAVIRSRSGTRGAYHLAALVGLYLVRNKSQSVSKHAC